MLDQDTGDINPLTGIGIVRAVNRRGSKLILCGTGRNKFKTHCIRGHPAGYGQCSRVPDRGVAKRKENREHPRQAGCRTAYIRRERSPYTASAACARHVHPRTELAGILKQVAYYPLVMRGEHSGAMDMWGCCRIIFRVSGRIAGDRGPLGKALGTPPFRKRGG